MPVDAERRLVAIFAADVEGYSRLMGTDEVGTLRDLIQRRTILDGLIASHRGRIANTAGDSVLAEFGSAVDAVRCAVEAQAALAKANEGASASSRIEFRIGVHVGDVMVKGGDLFGDGVNIAARLEGIAKAGGVCISDDAQRQIRGKVDVDFDDMGLQSLKNIAEPMRTWRVRLGANNALSAPPGHLGEQRLPLALPNKPSIAVLPFQNMSGDPEQEYFADGIAEDIITALSRFKSLFVIARNSSFTYKGRAIDIKQVGRELGVRYVLEGSVRKAGGRVRITGQLIDSDTGAHLWADRFDGTLEDIFDLQDQVTASVVGAIAPRLERVEIERAKRKPTESLDAYDYFLRAMASVHEGTRESNGNALRLFRKAIELDQDFAAAYGMAAYCFVWRKTNGWMANAAQEVVEAEQLARRSVELGKDDAVALSRGGHALAYVVADVEGGVDFIDRALSLNPNLATAWYASGWTRVYRGELDAAIEHLGHAMRLSPLDPETIRMQAGIATAHFLYGHYDEASLWAQKALREQPSYLTAIRVSAASSALAGRSEQARKEISTLRGLDPGLRVSNLKDRLPFRRPGDLARYAEGLRKAGLPE